MCVCVCVTYFSIFMSRLNDDENTEKFRSEETQKKYFYSIPQIKILTETQKMHRVLFLNYR
jgi:hypothetical protein